ncbi:MAG: hypothetical protein ACM3ZU_00375 [Bacteroidota bacterium]
MRFLVVTDFDGCLVTKGADLIAPEVAQRIKRINDIVPVIIVTARASARAVSAAAAALDQVSLGAVPFFHRDMNLYDNSSHGIISAKVAAIQQYVERHGLEPAIGIGDESDDEVVYRMLGMIPFRVIWGTPDAVRLSTPAEYCYTVSEDGLPELWDRIHDDIARLLLGRNPYGTAKHFGAQAACYWDANTGRWKRPC